MYTEFWSAAAAWLPAGIVISVFAGAAFILGKGAKKSEIAWAEEQNRKQRVKDLYPEHPSYEERMGVQYGPKQE